MPVKCTNTSCDTTFEPKQSGPLDCSYHPGGPVFHEGTKAWSCCKEINKPVLDFDEFMKIPGCTKGPHSSEKQAPVQPLPSPNAQPPASTSTSTSASQPTTTKGLVETYGTPSAQPSTTPIVPTKTKPTTTTTTKPEKIDWAKDELTDDPSRSVGKGSRCKRRACDVVWKGEDGASRSSLGEKEDGCRYHPGPPNFLEGSKGYLCCKPRVLDFDEFLAIPGCRTTTHLFLDPIKAEGGVDEEERVDCRLDHYQTPDKVMVSCFAKGVDKTKSSVVLTSSTLEFDLYLPANKRCVKLVELYDEIDVESSDYKILGTKIELGLKKLSAGSSWPILQKPAEGSKLPPGYALTFGVQGRTGTVGGKEMVIG